MTSSADFSLDVTGLRAAFPALNSGWAFFDGPGGTQTPTAVGDAMRHVITQPLSNRGRLGVSDANADAEVLEFRKAFGDFLGVPSDGVVYGRSATSLTYDFARALAKTWQAGDNVVLSKLDHDCNVSPWRQAATAAGIETRFIDFDPATAELDLASAGGAINSRTRLVAVTGASNLLGTIPPVAEVAALAHAHNALVYVDAVHLAAHALVDTTALGADFVVCSPYKFLGPHCAVLGADPGLLAEIWPDKLEPATAAVPERFELGTLPYEVMAGARAAVDFIADLTPATGSRRERLAAGWAAIHHHESQLLDQLLTGLERLGDRVELHSRASQRTPTTLVTFPGQASVAVSEALAERQVFAPADFFYAHQPMLRLALADSAALRVGMAPYNTTAEVDRLLAGLEEIT